jgi:PAS domain S-box-containing protein
MTLYAILLLTATLTAAGMLMLSHERWKPRQAYPFLLAAWLLLGGILHLLRVGGLYRQEMVLVALTYLAGMAFPATVLAFLLDTATAGKRLSPGAFALLILVPLLAQLFLWTDPLHGLLFSTRIVDSDPAVPPIVWLGWIHLAYVAAVLAAGLLVLFRSLILHPRPRLVRPVLLLAAGLLAALSFDLLSLGGSAALPGLGMLLPGYILLGAGLLVYTRQVQFPEIPTIPREALVEGFNDGLIVVNRRNQIVDMNPAAEKIIGVRRRAAFGEPVEVILSDWSNLTQNNEARELEFRSSININQAWRSFEVRLSTLQDESGEDAGKVILLRDVTDRRKQTDTHQQARDEMFILLHSIFGAASQARSTRDFLHDAMYQIVYSFRSQDGLIYLFEAGTAESKKPRLVLSAQHGPLTQNPIFLAHVQEICDALALSPGNKQPVLIPDGHGDMRFSSLAEPLDTLAIAILPMLKDLQVVGVLVQVRTEGPPYNPDEIVRLSVIAEELATFIHTDRQRKLNIAMAERQRLVRDLHDSITQKLYGLVTLTGAVQLGVEQGATDRISDMVGRIGDNARQALREMRLFLHELEPVDLEHEGLVSVLHQRLASVEGRSDIKARLVADEKISLSVEKEVALYFIAQEALNNILRHARAKAVLVRLKRKKQMVVCEITDDGCGFDTAEVGVGGLGLKNMRERTAQIGATLKIDSAVGKGTTISISVPADNV